MESNIIRVGGGGGVVRGYLKSYLTDISGAGVVDYKSADFLLQNPMSFQGDIRWARIELTLNRHRELGNDHPRYKNYYIIGLGQYDLINGNVSQNRLT